MGFPFFWRRRAFLEGGVGAVMSISSSSGSDFLDFSFFSFLGGLVVSFCWSRFLFLGFSVGGVEVVSIDGEGSPILTFLLFFSFLSFSLDLSFDLSFFDFVGFTSSIPDFCAENFCSEDLAPIRRQ